MKYAVILPVYNEEEYLRAALESLIAQDLLPDQLVIVNDGSTDDTPKIIDEFVHQHAFIRVINKKEKKEYRVGNVVVQNFNLGYSTLDSDFEFVVKLDADITLPSHYFARIAEHFANDPKLGMAGGKQLILKNEDWVYESIGDPDHVKGPCKSYRKACLEEMNGLRPSIGWDSADEILARFYGWKVYVDEGLLIRHHRVTGTNTGLFKVKRRVGHGFFRIRYGFIVSLISAIKSGLKNPPYLLSGIAIVFGYLEAWWRGDKYVVSEEEGKYLRRFRWGRYMKKIGLKPSED